MSPTTAPHTLNRRRLLELGGLTGTALALGISAPAEASESGEAAGATFGLGVASGAPRPDGAVLWTRLALDPLAEDGHGGMPLRPAPVRWEVSRDPEFTRVQRRGNALAQPELAHSVHPRVEGLAPDTQYWYRFRSGQEVSPVGRFRTLPAPGQQTGAFSFGLVSCQAWYHGHFTAHRHLAQEEDLDLVVFVGDYIYEYGITADNLWRQGASVAPAHEVEIETLEQYRLRYSLFKSDAHLQAVHARAAAVAVWDDHEVQNNYAAAVSGKDVSPEDFEHQIAVAYRAFYENMPLDLEALPTGPDADITSGFDVGTLARFSLLDSRQFRDPEPADAQEQNREQRTILGAQQESWIEGRLSQSTATWDVLANGVVLTAVSEDRTDMWDGYPAARRRLMTAMSEVSNPVMLTGDIHKHVAAELKEDFADPSSETIGVELVCTSVASDGDGAETDAHTADWTRHPYVRHYDGRRGYVHVRLTPQEMTSSFWVVPWIEADDTAPKELSARFSTRAGEPGLAPAGEDRA